MTPAHPAAFWIEHLGLVAHPEGGHFRESYRSRESISATGLPARFDGPRALATAIYYLLRAGELSTLHRIRSDEVWHHYAGGALRLSIIAPAGALTTAMLGGDPERGESLQVIVPAGAWFGAELACGDGAPTSVEVSEMHGARSRPEPPAFALAGCTVAPGFEFADFELGARADLLRRFPQHRAVIERLTR